jgi:hypothetical protein
MMFKVFTVRTMQNQQIQNAAKTMVYLITTGL